MNKKKGIISLIVTAALLVLLAFTCFKGFGELGTGATRNITLGLDLAGGVSITYQVKDENPTSEEMSDTIYKLQRRVEQYSTEASVYQEGDDRINIEIPGVTDANTILDELGKPGSLEFQTMDGETVITGSDVETASVQSGQNSTTGATEYSVELDLTEEGTDKFAEATSANVGSQIAIIYDGKRSVRRQYSRQSLEDRLILQETLLMKKQKISPLLSVSEGCSLSWKSCVPMWWEHSLENRRSVQV